jgi:hypothetical protein
LSSGGRDLSSGWGFEHAEVPEIADHAGSCVSARASPFFEVTGPYPSPLGPDGMCLVMEGPAPDPFGEPFPAPATHIRTDQEWSVGFSWETLGSLNYLMAGTWELTVYLEEMGGGEFALPLNVNTIPFVSGPSPYALAFAFAFDFAAGVVPEGAYRVVTTVDMIGPGGFQGPISAVGEGPILRFYEVGP